MFFEDNRRPAPGFYKKIDVGGHMQMARRDAEEASQ
jgi:hypothetical protein